LSVNPRPRPAFGAAPITRTAPTEIADPGEDVASPRTETKASKGKGKGVPKALGKARAKTEPKKIGRKRSAASDDKSVEVVVRLKKSQRRRLKERAAVHGMTPEEAVTKLIGHWLDG
jgi:hypothetical protein